VLVLTNHAILCSRTLITFFNEAQLYAYVQLSIVQRVSHYEGETVTHLCLVKTSGIKNGSTKGTWCREFIKADWTSVVICAVYCSFSFLRKVALHDDGKRNLTDYQSLFAIILIGIICMYIFVVWHEVLICEGAASGRSTWACSEPILAPAKLLIN